MTYFEGAYDVGMGNFLNANYNLNNILMTCLWYLNLDALTMWFETAYLLKVLVQIKSTNLVQFDSPNHGE